MQDPSLYEHTLRTAVKAQTQQPEVQLPFSEQQEQQLPCPRCHSTNTKFCYYNNYNLTQPRHFCRACRRHWTKGGTLRNIPVGGGGSGGPRKNSKRSSTSTAAVAAKQVPSSSKNRNVCDLEGQNGNFVSSAAMEGQFGGFVESSSGSNSGVNGQYADPYSGRDAGQIPGPGSSHHWW